MEKGGYPPFFDRSSFMWEFIFMMYGSLCGLCCVMGFKINM